MMLTLALSIMAGKGPSQSAGFNYAEALQKSLFFYEAQQSGRLSPNNRVEWRGDACLKDGKDIGADLSGGLFDAGDHWTANLTMSFSAMTLAWSAVEHPEGWEQCGQMGRLLETLIHVNRYFDKCVLNPSVSDPALQLQVAIGCGGREGVPERPVHSMWAAAELAEIMTNRPTFRLDHAHPGADILAAMASAMAASAIVIRGNAKALKGLKGYEQFDANAFSARLLERAEKLTKFANAHIGPALTDTLPKEDQDRIRTQRNLALRSDGKVVEIGYRGDPSSQVFTALTWMARAATTPSERTKWMALADQVYEGPYLAESNNGFWKDFGAANPGKLGAYNMMRLNNGLEKYHRELQQYCQGMVGYVPTPGGLKIRERWAHQWGSLRHANNAATIAFYYSDWIQKSPPLIGNTWWKNGTNETQMKADFVRLGRQQVDYALGKNPYGRSYLVGFGKDPFNSPHHRGAYGPWGGFSHFIPGKPEYRETSRHILYGALLGGPDRNDVFLCGTKQHRWLQVEGTKEFDDFYVFPNRPGTPVRSSTYVWSKADLPVQDVMDAEHNEVALDYNAGFTANLNWLCAKGLSAGVAIPDSLFPPKEVRDASLDLKATDREFFVSGRRRDSTTVELTVWNRSRWPSQVTKKLSFRYYLLGGSAVALQGGDGASISPVMRSKTGQNFVEVTFPGIAIYPGDSDHETNHRTVALTFSGSNHLIAKDPSAKGLSETEAILPFCPVYSNGLRVGASEPVR